MWLLQTSAPDLPVAPDLRAAVPVNDTKLAGSAAFERTGPVKEGGGGYLRDNTSGYGFHITGTGPDGKYITADVVDRSGKRVSTSTPTPKFSIVDDEKIIAMFDLISSSKANVYKRPGFSGDYVLCREKDGTCGLYYSGGKHESGLTLPAQTFHHGYWDYSRKGPPISGGVSGADSKALKIPPVIVLVEPVKKSDPEVKVEPVKKLPPEVKPEPVKMPPPEVKPAPVKNAEWSAAATKVAVTAMGKDNGIAGSGDRQGFAAVFYREGALTNFHRNHPGGDPDVFIPYEKLPPGLKEVQKFTLKTSDASTAETFRASAVNGATVVEASGKKVYLFRTESRRDGFGVVLIEGSDSSLPPIVSQAYSSAVGLGNDNCLATNRWMLMDGDTKRYAMVRANGQVIICTAGSKEAEMFDPLQAILQNAKRTKAQEEKKETSWATLKDLYAEKEGPKFRKVVWDARGFWKYTTRDVPTIGPERDEPPVPKE